VTLFAHEQQLSILMFSASRPMWPDTNRPDTHAVVYYTLPIYKKRSCCWESRSFCVCLSTRNS